MINKNKLINDLEDLLNGSLDPATFPYQKGNSIRIGKYAIRRNKQGFYSIFDCKNNEQLTQTFCKTSAVAIAKSLTKGVQQTSKIVELDKEIQKWYNDCVFYKHTMKVTKDLTKWEVTSVRYGIAKDKTESIKRQLDKIIFG